jgi:adenine-specific DNA-methyltransferase
VGHSAQRYVAPIPQTATGRIAVKVINHLGDEVMKVFVVR